MLGNRESLGFHELRRVASEDKGALNKDPAIIWLTSTILAKTMNWIQNKKVC